MKMVVPTPRRRASRACDTCHRRGAKCTPAPGFPSKCTTCLNCSLECTYNRPQKRRGPAPGFSSGKKQHAFNLLSLSQPSAKSDIPWKAPFVASHESIIGLLQCYQQVVYPIFPYFHWPSFIEKVESKLYQHDPLFFSNVMAACALASARVRDGALTPDTSFYDSIDINELKNVPSEKFFTAAKDLTFGKNGSPPEVVSFDHIRAAGLLAVVAIQYGQPRIMHQCIGFYHTLSNISGFHLENRWPSNIDHIEREERRRVFWSMYTLDVFTSIVWGGSFGVVLYDAVMYPTELDDEYITATALLENKSDQVSWIAGWNLTTDLYRVMATDVFRHRRNLRPQSSSFNPYAGSIFGFNNVPSHKPSDVLNVVDNIFNIIPPIFRHVQPLTSIPHQDRFSFQAANLIVTAQTVRMIAVGTDDISHSKQCEILGELLQAIKQVPMAYLRAISSPLLYHLSGIGQLLGEVIRGPISQANYIQIRKLLLMMADLLNNLEINLCLCSGASAKMIAHVERIDQYMSLPQSYNNTTSNNNLDDDVPTLIQDQPHHQEASPQTYHSAVQTPTQYDEQEPSPLRTSFVQSITLSSIPFSNGPPTNNETNNESWNKNSDVPGPIVEPEPPDNFNHQMQHESCAYPQGPPNFGDFQLPEELLQSWPFDLGLGNEISLFPDLPRV